MLYRLWYFQSDFVNLSIDGDLLETAGNLFDALHKQINQI